MNTLKDSKKVNSPESDMSTGKTQTHTPQRSTKPQLKKDELEKIAKELKQKLSKASVTAKQSMSSHASSKVQPPESPVSQTSLPKSSPLKSYYMWKRQMVSQHSPNTTSSPSLVSPDGRSPTSTKPSMFLASSPNKASRKASTSTINEDELNDSPLKRRRATSGAAIKSGPPQMVLKEINGGPETPGNTSSKSLNPSPVLTANPSKGNTQSSSQSNPQTTPTLPKKSLSSAQSQSSLLKTPTQSRRASVYNDDEGADLLMYLATSPSPAKPAYSNTPRASTAPNGSANHNFLMAKPSSNGASFISPPPPLTPKRPLHSTAKTPQNRLTPSLGLSGGAGVPGSALPSAGLALTPAGFNMGDYVNFFTPSPGGAQTGQPNQSANRNLLRTPDFVGLMHQKTRVDGKMINFDKVGLFGSQPNPESSKE
ncbi:hypothetical protein FDK38_000384 [Candidozyma auris]|nr:hypothetical protein FDK38_000384 [[Candida] auris]